MARRIVERYRRGFFGWIFLLLFWGWNLLMVWALLKGKAAIDCSQYTTEAECDTEVGLATMAFLFMWAIGSVVFGLLAYFTRGRKEIIEYDA